MRVCVIESCAAVITEPLGGVGGVEIVLSSAAVAAVAAAVLATAAVDRSRRA